MYKISLKRDNLKKIFKPYKTIILEKAINLFYKSITFEKAISLEISSLETTLSLVKVLSLK